MADHPPITIQVAGDVISMPVDFPVCTDDTITWQVGEGSDPWLVSFIDRSAFTIEPIPPGAAVLPNTVEVRNGQRIRVRNGYKGKFPYRVAIYKGSKIYGVFDCPSIIIT